MKPAQNPSIGVAVVKPRPGAEPTTFQKSVRAVERDLDFAAQRLADAQRQNQEFTTLAEKLAHTTICVRNVTVPQFVEAFPGRFMNWCVSQMFPHAKGGPLYVDNAYYEYDVEQCRRKAAIMRKAGMRYVWLEDNDTVESAERKLKGELK
jgi:hypothetical protein